MLKKTTVALIAGAISAVLAGCSEKTDEALTGVTMDDTSEVIVQQSDTQTVTASEPQTPKMKYDVSLATRMDICYTGAPLTPKMLIIDENDRQLEEDEYTVTYENNIEIGTAKAEIVIKADGQKFIQEFEIHPGVLAKEFIRVNFPEEAFEYTGKEQKQTPVLINTSDIQLVEGKDYTVIGYENTAGPGTVTVTLKGMGNYTDTMTASYAIKSPKVSGLKLIKSEERAVTIGWDKCLGAQGYQICTKGSEGYNVIIDINTGACAAEIGGLDPDTEYVFYIRPYLNSDGVAYYPEGTESIKVSTTVGAPDKVIITEGGSSGRGTVINWEAVSGANKYIVQRHNGTDWVQIAAMTGLTFTDNTVASDGVYRYRVAAVKTVNGKDYRGEFSEERIVTFGDADDPTSLKSDTVTEVKCYYFTASENVTDLNGTNVGTLKANSIYSGYIDPEYPGKIVIDFMYIKCLVSDAHAVVKPNSKVLGTACIGQMGGKIWGQASCGPTAVAMLTTWQAGTVWNKDDLILYSEEHKLNDQGSLRKAGGMTAPMMLQLISGYSNGEITASNIYGSGNTVDVLKAQIDSGNRAIVVCQYTNSIVTHYNSGTHFVVVCGYEEVDGELFFYYADPYYSYGGDTLRMISSKVLAASMDMVKIEPRCIIVLDK